MTTANKSIETLARNCVQLCAFFKSLQGFPLRASKIHMRWKPYWEPSVAQGTHSYFNRLPALGRFYQETKFSL